MSSNSQAPFTWAEIEMQVRKAVLCQLSILERFGPNDSAMLEAFLGLNLEEHDSSGYDQFPLERHELHKLAKRAFAYAYQTDDWHQADGDDYYDVACGILSGGYPQTDVEGEPSPLSEANDFPLRRMFETFVARWKLSSEDYTGGLTVRELALLSNMTVPAVRTSLSKEGFKLEPSFRIGAGKDENNVLREEDSLKWLLRRRGFTPNRSDKPSDKNGGAGGKIWIELEYFPEMVRGAMESGGHTVATLAASAAVSPKWLQSVADGREAEPEVASLRSLARCLCLSEAEFASKGIRHLISIQLQDPTVHRR